MACNEIVYKGNKYSEQEFLDMMNNGQVEEVETLEQPKDEFYQAKGDITSSRASDQTVKEFTDWFKNTGIDFKTVIGNIRNEKGEPLDVNEAVDVMNKVVQVVEGHENTSIPEAGMHIVARIVKEQNPKLFKEMMNKISSYKILDDVVRDYRGFKNYQLPDGKPDMAKMKEEAIGKVLAEYYIGQQEGEREKPELLDKVQQSQSWWNRIKEWLSDFFKENPFTKVTKEFANELQSNIPGVSEKAENSLTQTTIRDNRTSQITSDGDESTLFYQTKSGEDKQKRIFDELKAKASTIRRDIDAKGNSSYIITGQGGKEFKPSTSPSTESKKVYEKAFGKDREPTPHDKILRETGTRLHSYVDDILNRAVDPETGNLRPEIQKEKGTISPGEESEYDKLENYVTQVLSKFPEGTKFLHEIAVYKPGTKGKPGKDDIAGTMDFIAITPDGGVHNKDWKFMEPKSRDDISVITQQAHKKQLYWYGEILKKGYGVDNIYESSTIPISMEFGKNENSEVLQGIRLASADYQEINSPTMLPVIGGHTEIKGDKKATELLQYLSKLEDKWYNKKVPAKGKKLMERKIQDLSYAKRVLYLKGNTNELVNIAFKEIVAARHSIDQVKKLLEQSTDNLDAVTSANSLDILNSVSDSMSTLSYLEDLRVDLNDFIKDLPEDEKEELGTQFDRIGNNIKAARNEIKELNIKALEKAANAQGIFNILTMDKEVNPLQRLWNSSYNIPIRTVNVLYKYRADAENRTNLQYTKLVDHIRKLKEEVDTWSGGDKDKLANLIAKKDINNNYRPSLINKISNKFYEYLDKEVRKAPNDKNITAIKSMINVDAYKTAYEEGLKIHIENANKEPFDIKSYKKNPAERKGTLDQELREKSIEWYKETFNVDSKTAFTPRNGMLRSPQFIKEEFWSDEYKNLNKPENKPALDFYNYVVKLNERAHNSGLLGDYYRSFVPQMAKRSVEHVFDGAFKLAGGSFIKQFVVLEGERRYRDSFTGEIDHNLHGKFTYDLGEEGDYSRVSDDIIQSVTQYAKEVIAYEELHKIEGLARALHGLEKTKQVLSVSKGKVALDITGKPIGRDNVENLKLFEKVLNGVIYNDKLGDVGIGEGTVEINGKDYNIDYAKTLNTAVGAFSLKSLGLSPTSMFSNLFGGTVNQFINSGKHFTPQELKRAYFDILQAKFNTDEGKKLVSLLNHFVPLTEDLAKHFGREMNKSQYLNWLSGDGLMILLRKSDNIIQMANSSVYFQNTMIENGKLVNIREFVRKKYNYDNAYNLSPRERKELIKKINSEVEQLQKTRNLFNDPKIKYSDDTFNIDLGVESLDASELNLRERIRNLTRDCLGARTSDEMAGINTTLLGTAFMGFRNWIPRLTQKRFGNFNYNAGLETFEAGRVRMMFDVINDNMTSKITNIKNLVTFSHGGSGEMSIIDIAKRQYQRRIQEFREIEEGESMFEKTVSEAEFIDNYLHDVKSQVRELEATVVMMFLFAGALQFAKSIPKDDDNYPERGAAKYAVRMLDKFSDELGFFYSYGSVKSITGSDNIIPMLSTINDLSKFISHLAKEGYYMSTGDEESEHKNKLLKYPISYIPVVNQMSSYFGMLNAEWAEEMGYTTDYHYGGAFGK